MQPRFFSAGRGNFRGCPAHCKALGVSAAVYAAKGIVQSSITAWHALQPRVSLTTAQFDRPNGPNTTQFPNEPRIARARLNIDDVDLGWIALAAVFERVQCACRLAGPENHSFSALSRFVIVIDRWRMCHQHNAATTPSLSPQQTQSIDCSAAVFCDTPAS